MSQMCNMSQYCISCRSSCSRPMKPWRNCCSNRNRHCRCKHVSCLLQVPETSGTSILVFPAVQILIDNTHGTMIRVWYGCVVVLNSGAAVGLVSSDRTRDSRASWLPAEHRRTNLRRSYSDCHMAERRETVGSFTAGWHTVSFVMYIYTSDVITLLTISSVVTNTSVTVYKYFSKYCSLYQYLNTIYISKYWCWYLSTFWEYVNTWPLRSTTIQWKMHFH